MLFQVAPQRFASFIGSASIVLAAVLSTGCAAQHSAPATSVVPTLSKVHAVIAPPPSGAYFGAFVNPSPGKISQMTATSNLENTIGRTLALHLHYRGWADLASINSDPDIRDDVTNGRTPVISWNCVPTGGNIESIPTHAYDTQLQNISAALRSFGHPIFLRWFWEFNLNIGSPTNNPNGNNCFASGATVNQDQSDFISAWTYIYQTLHTGLGSSNLTFVWNPDVGLNADGFDESNTNATPNFYPGSQYVDWIGGDAYDKEVSPPTSTGLTFDQVWDGFFSAFAFATYGKPLMVGETGSCYQYGAPETQAAFIQQAQNSLETNFNNVGAFVYFDAPGGYDPPVGNCSWVLQGGGLTAFANMGQQQYFGPRP